VAAALSAVSLLAAGAPGQLADTAVTAMSVCVDMQATDILPVIATVCFEGDD
jgi:hypothetical protein